MVLDTMAAPSLPPSTAPAASLPFPSSSSPSSSSPSSSPPSSSPPSSSFPSFPSFSKGDLQVLAGVYQAGTLLKWDEMSLFDQLFADGSEPEMFVLSMELSELHGNMVIVVAPGSQDAWILRIALAPEFIWLGLHWAGLPYPGKYQSSASKQ
jgi:hypothetical protein